jgi:proline iminopeptidase
MQPLSIEQRSLYPKVRAHRTGYLSMSQLHSLYYECSGNRDGNPVLFLHGGPGGGSHSNQRRYFDKAAYRIILFDQRGCGRSTPRGCLEDNTTKHSVDDIEALRMELDIDAWLVAGGSWGSALALAYAQAHPNRVKGLILWGIFLLRPSEIGWFYQQGANFVFPDVWQQFLEPIPAEERDDLVAAYYRRLCGSCDSDQVRAACAWSGWEAAASTLLPDVDRQDRFARAEFAVPFARVECHYIYHGGFFRQPDQLLDGVECLRRIPAQVIQGRYDMVCPMTTAWDLHQRWPEAGFEVVDNGAHSSFEPAMVDAIVRATDRFRNV